VYDQVKPVTTSLYNSQYFKQDSKNNDYYIRNQSQGNNYLQASAQKGLENETNEKINLINEKL